MGRFHRNADRPQPTRKERRVLMEIYGISSGRQWVKLRKGIQRAVRKAKREAV